MLDITPHGKLCSTSETGQHAGYGICVCGQAQEKITLRKCFSYRFESCDVTYNKRSRRTTFENEYSIGTLP